MTLRTTKPGVVTSVRQPILEVSWSLVRTLCDVIAHDMRAQKPLLIVAIARGGLVPATIISHTLDVPLEVVHCTAYEGTRRTLQKPIVVEGWQPYFNECNVVFVDDIMDTGDTWKAIQGEIGTGHLHQARLYTLFKKDTCKYPEHEGYCSRVAGDVWVKFPWESDT